ncbi:uncharacterized protein LOC124919361 isoform X2 [Impatiens glandulifera]|uniref:uncharacterized protein LOC124919361 isoform X2 n=1 Tax=Impatiens glandulifera TaxID=253017 RepID=UPI001FB079C4|nr:uncharacterized protein LOC124919361 isoform X2 [Impatiens glandulifera]
MAIASTAASETKPESNSKVKGQGGRKKKEKGSQIPEDGTLSQSSEIVEEKQKQKRKRTENPGVRLIGGRLYDSENGKSCHQCRQKTMDVMAPCKNKKKDKQCTILYCHKCLLNRYGEKAEQVSVVEDWFCPRCRGNCNCSFCMKKRGHKPTGILVHTAKSIGFSSVSEMLLVRGSDNQSGKEPPLSIQEKQDKNIVSEDTDIDLADQKCKKVKEENVQDGRYNDVVQEMQNGDLKSGTKGKTVRRKPTKLKVEKDSICSISRSIVAEIPLPEGSELKSVLSIELQPEEVGHALQFLEFCTAFGEVIELKKDEPQYILRDIVRGGRVREGKSSPVAQFLVQSLSLIQSDSGEGSPVISHSLSHKNSWLRALHKCLSESKYLSEQLKLDQFDGGADSYDSLNSIERLILVNFVCDEVLCTSKVRTYIDEQKLKFYEKVKENKEKVVAAKQKKKQLKQQMRDEVAQAIIAKNSIPLSISEHEAIVSKNKMQVAEAHDEMLQSKEMLCTEKQYCKAIRTKPILVDTEGHSFWRLKGFDDEFNVLRLDASLQPESEYSEKWFIYEEQKEEMEKYLSFRQTR